MIPDGINVEAIDLLPLLFYFKLPNSPINASFSPFCSRREWK
jgi:hypothetical protein